MAEHPQLDVLVVGSINMDLVARVDRFPEPGETIVGSEFRLFAGGKGANQAVAVAKLGGRCGFVGKVGNDPFGHELEDSLRMAGIAEVRLSRAEESSTGVALIAVDRTGQNEIVVVPGANAELKGEEVRGARDLFGKARVILLQLETTTEAVTEAIRLARDLRKLVILNPAPAQPFPERLFRFVDFLTPNESELAVLSGKKVESVADAEFAAAVLVEKGARNVVVTLGAEGCLYYGPGTKFHLPAHRVEAVDATAAGDVFNGAFALALARESTLKEALEFANAAAAISVTRPGAQNSVPSREEVEQLLRALED